MFKLFIPTRNRPTSLAKVLNFYSQFYPDVSVLIADGSDDRFKEINKVNVAASPLAIDYRPYEAKIGLIERCTDVLESEMDEFIVFGADDDYLNLRLLQDGALFLAKNPDYISAMGLTVKMKNDANGCISHKFSIPRPIISNDMVSRMKYYSSWSFPTSYAVTRRTHFLERLKLIADYGRPSFFDFIIGLHDVSRGKLKVIPDIGLFATYNRVHSNIRSESKLSFLHDSASVLAIQSMIVQELIHIGGLTATEAENISANIIRNRIAELCGRRFPRLAIFAKSRHFKDEIVQAQYLITEKLFTKGTAVNKKYSTQIDFVHLAMQEVNHSDDNAGESKILDIGSFVLKSS